MRKLALFTFPLLILAACEPPPVNCTLEAVAGLNVTVEDATGAAVCDAVVTARDGEFEETLESVNCSYFGAFERAGTYEITARTPGFIAVESGVVVEDAECHVVPASVEMTLENVGCTEEARPGLEITVLDDDGARVCDALVVARDGDFEQLLENFGGEDCAYFGAEERAGTYEIDVSRSGFELESLGPITVEEDFDGCHVVTEQATAELTPVEACTASIEIGLSVTVLDDATGDPICDATVTAEDGDFSETLTASGGACETYLGVEERPAGYTVRAAAPGHAEAVERVIILSDGCHPILEEVTLRLATE
jgi:hypothetical protein